MASGQSMLLQLLFSGFFAIACFRASVPQGDSPSLADLLRFPGRLERLRRSRWQWFAMVALMIVVRLQQQLPLFLELTAAVQFLLFVALPTRAPEVSGRGRGHAAAL